MKNKSKLKLRVKPTLNIFTLNGKQRPGKDKK